LNTEAVGAILLKGAFVNFCLLYKEDYPWDVRVEKLAKTLAKSGHKVTIVCRNLDGKKTTDEIENVQIRRLPRIGWLPHKFRKFLNFPLWFSPVWFYILYTVARRHSTDVIIVRDLPLMYLGLIVGRLVKARVIFDMAECYPEMYRSGSEKKSLATRILKSPAAAAHYEKHAARLADRVLVMIEESRDRLVRLGISASKISIVSNTPPLEKFAGEVAAHNGDHLRIVYVGFVTEIRGLDLLIRAVRDYVDTVADPFSIKVDIIGQGTALPSLVELVNELGLQDRVDIHGWLGHEEVSKLVSSANIGALTYKVCNHWNTTIPNKIFDYMLAGLPVLATEVVPIARILRSTNCGLVCKDGDVNDVAQKLILLRSADLRAKLGKNGYRAVKECYNWENDARTLLKVAEELVER
jgi:glycosyltransferase involved in cell wall biosynthesis